MKIDLDLLRAHRREANGPDPPPREEMPFPDLPQVVAPRPPPPIPLGQTGEAASLKTVGRTLTPPPPPASVAGGLSAARRPQTTAAPQPEMRLISTFISKWELEPARTRVLLARLSPWKRHYVIDNFTCNTSGSIVAALETYIESCDKNNLWASSAPQRQASASEVATPPRRTVPSVVKPPKARDRSRSRDAARKDAEQARRTSQPHGTEGNEASLIREQPVNAQGKANAVARSKAAANQKTATGTPRAPTRSAQAASARTVPQNGVADQPGELIRMLL